MSIMGNDTQPIKHIPNPTGKGGFVKGKSGNPGGRPKNAESFAYWYQAFKNMTVGELEQWTKDNPKDTRTVAADLAYQRVFNAQNDLKEFQEVADRSEGKPKQTTDLNVSGNVTALVEFVDGSDPSQSTNTE
jgi:hypothetical protein